MCGDVGALFGNALQLHIDIADLEMEIQVTLDVLQVPINGLLENKKMKKNDLVNSFRITSDLL